MSSFTLLDWRRRVAAIYRDVRADSDFAGAHGRWCAARDDLMAHHPDSPILPEARDAFNGLRYGPYDRAMHFEASVETGLEPAAFNSVTGTDGVVSFTRIGRVHLDPVGSLDVWWLNGYGGGIFIPIADPNPATYGGGRYVVDTVKGADLGGDIDLASGAGTLVVDLNFAYSPSCAYDPAWACPLAPPGNRVAEPVHVGELVGSIDPAPTGAEGVRA